MLKRFALGFVAHQGAGIIARYTETHEKYDMAQEEARRKNKPLLVVGGPAGSSNAYQEHWMQPLVRTKAFFQIKAHGCGDVCVDIDPHSCDGCNYVNANIMDLPFSNKEFGAAFCSHVVEHMPDANGCQMAWSELHRVADVVFICVPPKSSLFAWMVPDHHLWVRQTGEGVLEVEERDTGDHYLVDLDGPPLLYE
tara:strand:- start:2613 stop:3197 length:585 start_codon:yes stop_codon:yes gene_type:complete